jgi:lysozyme family protein/peptidoglycan hydrolase-like protein with peptidoglycan-binding domain
MANLEDLFQKFKAGYEDNWKNMQIRPDSAAEAKKEAAKLLKNKSVYQQIEKITGVFWPFTGLAHDRESGFDLNTYLGNGQPLSRVTTIVPKGRGPFLGPNAFVDGAVDALRLEGFVGATDWSIARMLFRLEGFNGYGYHSRGVNSPYLWSGSTAYGPPEQRAGKFVADGVFDPNKVDPQLGVAVVLKELMALDPSISFDDAPSSPGGAPEPDVTLAEDVAFVQQSLNKLGIEPQLVEDGILGPRTKAAVSFFQRQTGLRDTGLPDAVTIAEIAKRSAQPTVATPAPAEPTVTMPIPVQQPAPTPTPTQPTVTVPIADALSQIVQRMHALEQMILLSNNSGASPMASTGGVFPTASANPNDPVNFIERVLGVARKLNIQSATDTTMTPGSGTPSADQLKRVVDVINAVIGQAQPQLGPVNGALGETIGNLLNGKKTAIGIGASLLTTLLAAVPFSPNAGGLAGLLGTIATSVPGLSQVALPVSIAMTIWGVLGKFEKWSQGTALPPKGLV